MTIYVDHDYIDSYMPGTDIHKLTAVSTSNGLVTVLMDKRAEQARYEWANAEFDEFSRLKTEMEKLFAIGDARYEAKQNAVFNPPMAPPPPPAAPIQGLSAWIPRQSSYPQGPIPTPVYTGPTQLPPPPPTGFSCNRCRTFNDYASANQPDGTYICFGCRK